ncbi:MAG: Xylose isomerase domain protein barrel, partial [Bryobacterales bacterium]|nr:Xylose isomerase domain protein barrel [Bryobacterales bacterium]
MRIGIGSWTYGWSVGVKGYPAPAKPLTALDLLSRARDFDIRLVQIADNLPLDRLPESELAELKQRAAEWNIELEIGTTGVVPEHLRRFLQLAQYLGARLVRSLLSDIHSRPDLPQAAASLREVLPAFEEANVCLALENYEEYTSRELAGLVREIDSPSLGVCLDTVNSFGAMETPALVVGELAPFVRSLHLKDFKIARVDSRMGYCVTGCPVGEGMLNIGWLLDELRAAGSAPNMI